MPVHNFSRPRGRIETITIRSKALAGNLLGDPAEREVAVYLPEGYDSGGEGYPLFVYLTGFTGSGLLHVGWKGFGESIPQRLDRLVAAGAMGPVVSAYPDCFTSLGGNQYVNSPAMGLWEDFLVGEMLPALEERFRVRRGREGRAVLGKSSGGYGAIVHGMKHADAWNAAACHSGDMAFDLLFREVFPPAVDRLAEFDRDVARFLEHWEKSPKVNGDDYHVLMTLAMAATYDPDPDGPKGIRLPVDLETCELDGGRWGRWLAHDPLELVKRKECRENLARLAGLYIDCGSRDQYHLHYGARRMTKILAEAGIDHRYEEFDDDHSSVDYRLDVSLPWLYGAITS
jgi:enterochelin esterase-like enzyme